MAEEPTPTHLDQWRYGPVALASKYGISIEEARRLLDQAQVLPHQDDSSEGGQESEA